MLPSVQSSVEFARQVTLPSTRENRAKRTGPVCGLASGELGGASNEPSVIEYWPDAGVLFWASAVEASTKARAIVSPPTLSAKFAPIRFMVKL
jgi:hypothetical protein